MTTLGTLVLILAAALMGGWILDLIRRGRLYVGYGIVLLALIVMVVVVAVVPLARDLAHALLVRLFPSEPVAVVGLTALLLLLIYLLHQLSVLSDRVATLTQELAIRGASPKAEERESGRAQHQDPRE